MKTASLVALALLSAALSTPLAAQAGGFTTGDVWMSSDALHASPSQSGAAIVRIDPLSGQVDTMVGSVWTSGFGSLAFDSYRHRLIWRGTVNPSTMAQRIWQVDGAGQLTDMGLATSPYVWFAPAGDGRIFAIEHTGGPQYVVWIDAANRVHRVLDAAGLAPYALPAGPFLSRRGLAYDPGTNALYACAAIDCDGVSHKTIVMGKLALSADGTRVAGPPTCASKDISSSFSTETAMALAHLPDGRLLVTCIAFDQSPSVPLPRLLSFDPASMSFTPFAQVGVANEAIDYRMDDGVWSSALNKALVLDTFSDNLRAWAQGESGDGAVIPPVGSVSSAGGLAEAEQMAEISPTACDGAWVPYAIGLKGKGNFVPALTASGCPVPGGAFTLHVSDVVGGAGGTLFVGLSPAAMPFKGGTFAVGTVTLTVGIAVSGAPGAAGAGTLDLPAGLPAVPGLTGTSLYMQVGFSDAAAVKGVSLTQGLQMEIG